MEGNGQDGAMEVGRGQAGLVGPLSRGLKWLVGTLSLGEKVGGAEADLYFLPPSTDTWAPVPRTQPAGCLALGPPSLVLGFTCLLLPWNPCLCPTRCHAQPLTMAAASEFCP